MARFDDLLRSLPNMVDLLAEAGVSPDYLRTDRAFTSRWAFDDGVTPVATVWRDELSDLDGIPFVTYQDPSQRPDLKGTRKKNAEDRFRMLVVRSGSPIRVVLQTKKDERSGWEAGVSRRRALDPEPWFSSVGENAVTLRRGPPALVSIDGRSMDRRVPTYALRETRPAQVAFRARVAGKSRGRCALTQAPPELCDAAHFPWADWREHNESHHGVLLRRDLHAALDCGLLDIDRDGRVMVSTQLANDCPEYAELEGRYVGV